MSNGKPLEQLVATIEKSIADKQNVTVDSPKRLRDRVTGKLREHDVVLTIRQNHHTLRVAIECRDRSRPVTVEQIDAFSRKCRDTGIDQGIIVSTIGFYGTARKKAEHLHIKCYDIEEATSFVWMAASGIESVVRKLDHQEWLFRPQHEGSLNKTNMDVLDEHGVGVDHERLRPIAHYWLEQIVPHSREMIDQAKFCKRFNGSGFSLRNRETGETTPVIDILLTITYSLRYQMAPFRLVRYGSNENKKTIAEAAIAEVVLGNVIANFILVQQPGEAGRLMLKFKS